MKHYMGMGVCGIGLLLLGAVPALGQATFSYTTDFESDADGATPLGWVVANSGNGSPLSVGPSNDPKVMTADPAAWATQSALGAAGVVNYAVPWSGSKRFSILHPGWTFNEAFAGGATFAGAGATYSGTYPMNLQNNSLKAVFDLAMRSGRSATTTHGFVFIIQPVEDAQHVRIVGESYGREGYDQNGIGIEVDVYANNPLYGGGVAGGGDPNDNSHVGVNLYRLWDIAGSFSGTGITVPSLKTNLDQGVTIPFPGTVGGKSAWCSVGNNNQPLHFTVYYNDPTHGGLGVVQVYMKVRAADKAAGDPAVPTGQTPFSFGEGGSDPADGILMIETCVGAWPASGAAFGFVAARSGSSHISQVDNVHVETNAVASGTPCTVTYPTGSPVFDIGATATLTETPVQTDLTGMTQRGWDVASYRMADQAPGGSWPTRLDVFKGGVRWQSDGGMNLGAADGEPSLNYWTAGGGGGGLVGNVGDNRLPPGLTAGQTWIGILAKGWIYFPAGNTDYDLCMNADNGYEVRIGNQVVSFSEQDGVFSSGLNGGSHFRLHVNEAGVYPIQVLWFDFGGGAYCEFYRRTDSPMIPYLLVGNTSWGLADQPLVFGLRAGQAAPDYLSEYTSWVCDFDPQQHSVTLATQPLQPDSTGLGSPGWNVRSYPYFDEEASPNGIAAYLQCVKYDEDHGFRGADLTGEPNLNYFGYGTDEGNLGSSRSFPGLPTNAWNRDYGLVCTGYIYFPQAGTYSLSMNNDDDARLTIGGQIVMENPADYGNGGTAGYIFNLTVNNPGVYTIEVDFDAYWWGNGLEFYRRTCNLFQPYVAVGASDGGLADQPIVYGALNSTPYYADLSATPVWNVAVVELSPTEKVGEVDAATGNRAFNTKVVHPWFYWWGGSGYGITNNGYEDGTTAAWRWLDGLSTMPGSTQTLNFGQYVTCDCVNGGCWWQGMRVLQPGPGNWESQIPGTGWTSGDYCDWYNFQFAVRADGYAVFDHAGDYLIGLESDDNSRMIIGNQVIKTEYCCAWMPRVAQLHVTDPGTYPIRIDWLQGGGGWHIVVYESVPGHPWVLLNDNLGTIRVYDSINGGTAFTHTPNGTVIPPACKVAEVGQGGNLGWNATFTKVIDGSGNPLFTPHQYGQADAMIGNNIYVPSLDYSGSPYPNGIVTGYKSEAVTTVDTVDFRDPSIATQSCGDWGVNQSRFAVNNAWGTVFSPPAAADNNTDFVAKFTGFIEFPNPGDYIIGMIINSGYIRIADQYISGWLTDDGGPTDNDMMPVHIEAAGIYNISANCFRSTADKCGSSIESVYIGPDGTAYALNDPTGLSPVKVYRDVAAKQTTQWENPTIIPASAKVGGFRQGGQSGFHLTIVTPNLIHDHYADSWLFYGPGHDTQASILQTGDALDSAIGATLTPPLPQHPGNEGTVVFDGVVPVVDFRVGNYAGEDFPAGTPTFEWMSARVTGYLALKKGGHLLTLGSDDGAKLWLGQGDSRMLVCYSGSATGKYDQAGYVLVPEDGVYPFQVDYRAGGAPNCLWLEEGVPTIDPTTQVVTINWVALNTGDASKSFTTLCPAPFADTDGDHDVDMADFGVFQGCFTGTPAFAPMPAACRCFNRTGAADEITAEDYNAFVACWTGPTVEWVSTPDCP